MHTMYTNKDHFLDEKQIDEQKKKNRQIKKKSLTKKKIGVYNHTLILCLIHFYTNEENKKRGPIAKEHSIRQPFIWRCIVFNTTFRTIQCQLNFGRKMVHHRRSFAQKEWSTYQSFKIWHFSIECALRGQYDRRILSLFTVTMQNRPSRSAHRIVNVDRTRRDSEKQRCLNKSSLRRCVRCRFFLCSFGVCCLPVFRETLKNILCIWTGLTKATMTTTIPREWD